MTWIGGAPPPGEQIPRPRLRPTSRSRDELRAIGCQTDERVCESCPTGRELVTVCSLCKRDAATECRCTALDLRRFLRFDLELRAAEDVGSDSDDEPYVWESC